MREARGLLERLRERDRIASALEREIGIAEHPDRMRTKAAAAHAGIMAAVERSVAAVLDWIVERNGGLEVRTGRRQRSEGEVRGAEHVVRLHQKPPVTLALREPHGALCDFTRHPQVAPVRVEQPESPEGREELRRISRPAAELMGPLVVAADLRRREPSCGDKRGTESGEESELELIALRTLSQCSERFDRSFQMSARFIR